MSNPNLHFYGHEGLISRGKGTSGYQKNASLRVKAPDFNKKHFFKYFCEQFGSP